MIYAYAGRGRIARRMPSLSPLERIGEGNGATTKLCRDKSAAREGRLLARQLDGEFAVADALAEIVGIAGGGFLAVSCDQFGEGEK
jgi:hypothetical protein